MIYRCDVSRTNVNAIVREIIIFCYNKLNNRFVMDDQFILKFKKTIECL